MTNLKQTFEKETLRLFKELADRGHYTRALEVLETGRATIALVFRVSQYKPVVRKETL